MSKYVWSGINSFFMKGFSTLFAIVLGNLLLPAELGTYVSFMLVVSYATSLLSLNVSSGIVQKLNDETLAEVGDEYFTAGGAFVAALSVTVPLALHLLRAPLLGFFELTERSLLFTLALPAIFLQLNQKYCLGVLQARLDLKAMALVNTSIGAVKLGLALLLLEQGYGLVGIVAAIYTADLLGLALAGRRALEFHDVVLSPRFREVLGDLVRFSSVLHLSVIAVFLDKSVDLLLVNYLLPKESVAVYNYAIKGALLLLLFGNTISRVTYPELTTAFTARDTERVRSLYSRSIRLSFAALSVLTLGIVVHIEGLIPLVLPDFYLRMAGPFGLLAVGLVLFSSVATVGAVFTAMGVPGYGTAINWAALALNVLLCWFLIPPFGLLGAAAATATTFFLRSVAGLALAEHLFETGLPHARFGLAFLLFAGSTALIYQVDGSLLGRWAVAAACAVAVLLLTVRREEIGWLRRSLETARG